jgi:hypothetical protein
MNSITKDFALEAEKQCAPSRKPLDQVDLRTDVEHGQGLLWNDMQNECSGMCGV